MPAVSVTLKFYNYITWFSKLRTICNNCVIVAVLECTFASTKKVLQTSQKLRCTELERTKIAADSVKFVSLKILSMLKSQIVAVKFAQVCQILTQRENSAHKADEAIRKACKISLY